MAEAVHTAERLAELQALPLNRKIQITQTRIIEWYQRYKGNVCISFSGGKDSTVLLHIARQIYPDIPAVFSNTGLEYPEIQRFVKSKDNIDIVTPSIRFDEVISTYGYPLISKEVAEAIYYARRIRSQTVNVERERERERESNRQAEADGVGRDAEADGRKHKETSFRRKDLHGIRKKGESSRPEGSCKENNGSCKNWGGVENTSSRRVQQGTGVQCSQARCKENQIQKHSDKSCTENTAESG